MILTLESQQLKVNDFSDFEELPDSQTITYLVLRAIATAVESQVSEQFLLRILGLRSVWPLRCRIGKLIDKGILEPLPVANYG